MKVLAVLAFACVATAAPQYGYAPYGGAGYGYDQGASQYGAMGGSNLNAYGAQGSQGSALNAANSQYSQGAAGQYGGLAARDAGSSNSYGNRYGHTSSFGDEWGNSNSYDRSLAMGQGGYAQGAQGSANSLAAAQGSQGSQYGLNQGQYGASKLNQTLGQFSINLKPKMRFLIHILLFSVGGANAYNAGNGYGYYG